MKFWPIFLALFVGSSARLTIRDDGIAFSVLRRFRAEFPSLSSTLFSLSLCFSVFLGAKAYFFPGVLWESVILGVFQKNCRRHIWRFLGVFTIMF